MDLPFLSRFQRIIKMPYKEILFKLDYYANDFGDRIKRPISILFYKITKKPIVYVIGDSHSRLLKNNIGFIVHHIGPATAFNLNKESSTTRSKQKIMGLLREIPTQKSLLIFVFGEIDCRGHIYYQYIKQKKKISMHTLIKNTIANYLDFIKLIKSYNYKVGVLGITPASILNDPEIKTPINIRCKINSEFNRLFRIACKKEKIPYIDIYEHFADKKGYLEKNYTLDGVHISNRHAKIVKKLIHKQLTM